MTSPKIAIYNGATEPSGKPWFEFRNAQSDSGPVEILIYEQIGKDPWDDSGVGAKEFVENLKAIPEGREITLYINSPGGSVWDALAIYNQLKARKSQVTCIIDGVAASAASFIALAAKEVRMPENALFMIHDPWSMAIGSADDMRKAADSLEKHKDVILNIYAEKTGKSRDLISQRMTEETWFTGKEAKDFGFADTVLKAANINNSAAPHDLSRFRRVPEALRKTQNTAVQTAGKEEHTMDRKDIVALLTQHGATVAENATNEQLMEQLKAVLAKKEGNADQVANLQSEINALKDARNADRKARIEGQIAALVTECRIPANEAASWTAAVLANESILANLQKLPVNKPGEEPVSTLEIKSEDPRTITNHIKNLKGAEKATFIRKHENRILPFIANTNTIDTTLKRDVILDQMLRAFAKRLTPLSAFSTVFSNVQLQGTDIVQVPFFDLETATSTNFDAEDGYITGDTTIDNRPVTINKRKYQGLSFTSSEFRRQPFLKVAELAGLKAEKLAIDAWTDILSIVTEANYSTAVFTGAASTFDSDDVIDIKTACNQAHWPEVGRTLILESAYDGALQKDDSFKNALNFAGSEVLRQGKLPNFLGFDYYSNPNIPTNSENLKGFACFKSAILVATAPIEPTAEVRSQLSAYEMAVDPETGITLEYRRWGNPDFDTSKEIVEVNYGYNVGNAAALKRIVSA